MVSVLLIDACWEFVVVSYAYCFHLLWNYCSDLILSMNGI